MVERRKNRRLNCSLKTVIHKTLADGRTEEMAFASANLSAGGVFISAEDLSLFDLEEELAVVISDKEDTFYEGQARVVRSTRIFTPEKTLAVSGFGLMFIDAPPEFLTRIDKHIAKHLTIIL